METGRKKWDLNGPQVVRFYSPAEVSNSDSCLDTDWENELSPNKTPRRGIIRTPFSQVNRDLDLHAVRRESMFFERHMRAKSCPQNKVRSPKKKMKSMPMHDYNLRQTPSRLSRVMVHVQDDSESDEYLDADEYIHDSLDNPEQDVRCLRNRSIIMTSTAKKSLEGHQKSYDGMIPKNRRSSYVIAPPAINHGDISDNEENTLPFPVNKVSEEADRRSSYIVTDSKLDLSEIPQTPTLRQSSWGFVGTPEDSKENVFEVKYPNHKKFKSIKAAPRASGDTKEGKKSRSNHVALRRNTVFQPFTLKTNERCPKQDLTSTSQKEIDFASTLRHNTPKGKAKNPKLTKLSPFSFDQPRKRPREEDGDEEDYKPLAERVAAHFKTPTRFRTVPRHTVFKPTEKRYSPARVRPRTPKLQAVKRKRAVTILSHEQKMDLEAKQIKEYQFHARPFNQDLVNHPHVLKVEKKAPTKPEPLQLETEKRMVTRRNYGKQPEEPKYEFHAQKIPKGVLKGPMKLKGVQHAPLTRPKSPMFALKTREEKWKSFCVVDTSSAGVFRFKARPAPVPKSPQFVRPTRRTTMIQPFSFDEKDTERLAKKQKKIEDEIEKENKKYEFHAKEVPLSLMTPRPMRQVEKKMPTIPEPFNLASSSKYSFQRNESTDISIMKTRFKAKPATVLKKEPFIPQKCQKPPIECFEINLNTEHRAQAREQLKEERMSVNLERELAAQRYMEEQEQKEKEQLREFRKQLVHKAQPAPNQKPMRIKPSNKLPTSAQSPQFATNQRLRRKSN